MEGTEVEKISFQVESLLGDSGGRVRHLKWGDHSGGWYIIGIFISYHLNKPLQKTHLIAPSSRHLQRSLIYPILAATIPVFSAQIVFANSHTLIIIL